MMISSSSVTPWTSRCSSSIRRDQKPERLRRNGSGLPVPSNGVRRASSMSRTSLLLIAAGFGLAYGNWPGLAACVLLPAAAMLRRISVEEKELLRVLGTDYSRYQKSTRRLVPGLW